MIRFLLLSFCTFIIYASLAQAPPPESFGQFTVFNPETHEELSDDRVDFVRERIQNNISMLERKGISAVSSIFRPTAGIKFSFPLRQASGFNDPSFYGISNFVDHDRTGTPKDFNCGTRTYNRHLGTDFFTAPFWWRKMDEDAVEIIAAADGIIVDKADFHDDRNCVNCPTGAPRSCYEWNEVSLQHADGTISIYGHMKKNSVTTKAIGEAVVRGEYLGVVGSSGNSSGPHLHFEVWQDQTLKVNYDPWVGPCNDGVTESMWLNQEPYYNHKILKIISTPEAINRSKDCYDGAPEIDNSKRTFNLGELVNITVFARDNITNGPPYRMKLIKPDGTALYDWSLNAYQGHYAWIYYYYNFAANVINIPGTWKFQLTYDQDFAEHTFDVVEVLPLNLLSFKARKMGDHIRLDWQTADEINVSHFEIEKSTDASTFKTLGDLKVLPNPQKDIKSYAYNDIHPQAGIQYYRLRITDMDGSFRYSDMVKVDYGYDLPVEVFPNPATDFVELKNLSGYSRLVIMNMNGQTVYSKKLNETETRINLGHLVSGIYVIHLSGTDKDQKVKFIKK